MTFEAPVTCDWVNRTPVGDVPCGALWQVCERHAVAWAEAIAAAQAGSTRDVLADKCDALEASIRDLTRERDEARGALRADTVNQRAQLAEYGLADEFAAHVGCDLASGLGEALVVARRERDKLGEQIDILAVAAQDAVREQRRAAAAEAREAALREALVLVSGWLASSPLRRIADSARIHNAGITDDEFATLGKPALDALAAALALPADGTALDALLADLRCERDSARAIARVLASAYEADSRPPIGMVREALAFPVRP